MCSKKPGTRCSPHALEALESARNDFYDAVEQVKRERSNTSILTFQETKRKLEEAQFEYALSPDGQKTLIASMMSSPKGSAERARLSQSFSSSQRCIERRKGTLQELDSPITSDEFAQVEREVSRCLSTCDPGTMQKDLGRWIKHLKTSYESLTKQLVDHLNKDSDARSKTPEMIMRQMRVTKLLIHRLEQEKASARELLSA